MTGSITESTVAIFYTHDIDEALRFGIDFGNLLLARYWLCDYAYSNTHMHKPF